MAQPMDIIAMRKHFNDLIISEYYGDWIDNVPFEVGNFINSLTEEQKEEQIRIFEGEEKMEEELQGSYRTEDESLLEEYINMVVLNEEWQEKMEEEYEEIEREEYIKERRNAYMEMVFAMCRERNIQQNGETSVDENRLEGQTSANEE